MRSLAAGVVGVASIASAVWSGLAPPIEMEAAGTARRSKASLS